MKKTISLLLAIAIIAALAGCTGNAPSTQSAPPPVQTEPAKEAVQPEKATEETTQEVTVEAMDLVFSTNPVGTGYYSIAAGQGASLSNNTPLNVIVTPSTGPEGIIASLKSGEAQLGLSNGLFFDIYWDMTEGQYNVSDMRTLMNGNYLCFSFVVNANSGIESVADLAGKRVTFDGLSDTHKKMSEAILQAYGIDPQTGIVRQKMSFSTSGLTELAEGRTDAVIASIAGSKLEELASKIDCKVLPVAPENAAKVHDIYPALVAAKLAEEVPGGELGMPLAGQATTLYCGPISDEAAYVIVKTLTEQYDALSKVCAELEQWTKEAAASKDSVLAYHDGAIKYYKEIGIWTDEMDAWNKEAIAAYANK